MTTTDTSRRVTKSSPAYVLKATQAGDVGTVEAVVAVFNNLDFQGDRVMPGAFTNTLARWKESGDPIPVIWSHQWAEIDAHVGGVDPTQALELQPGDSKLPERIRDLGGLFVTMALDLTEDGGRKVFKLLKGRRIRQFSWGFDILEEAKGKDGSNEITEVDLHEVGPTLLGANPLTQLVGAKAGGPSPTTKEGPKVRTKAWVTLPNSLERLQESIRRAAIDWAFELYRGELYAVDVEATYSEEAILYVELWEDPPGRGSYFRAAYTAAAGGTVELSPPELVTLTAIIEPTAEPAGEDDEPDPEVEAGKALDRFRRKEGRRNSTADAANLQAIHDLTKDLGAACSTADAEPEEEADDEPEDEDAKNTKPSELLASLDAELETLAR